LRADWERERELASSEVAARLAALTTQLELANVQRVEFEELAERLRQELRDAAEDKKILEKKGRNKNIIPGLWIMVRSRIGSGFSDFVDPDPYWESGSRKHENRLNVILFN
jgi:hypothetical protein